MPEEGRTSLAQQATLTERSDPTAIPYGWTSQRHVAQLIRFCRMQPLGALGGLIVLLLVLTGILAPQIAPHGPKEANFEQYLPPSAEFPMGTDHLGRDMFSRVVHGAAICYEATPHCC